MLLENFNKTIDTWLSNLEAYSFPALSTQPSPGRWSVGQMYRHLIDDTTFFADQIMASISSDGFASENASPDGIRLLADNAFPDQAIEGAPDNAFIPQPESKEQLTADLVRLKEKMNEVAALIPDSRFKGKAKHPGLGYFSADEWLQFADMHFRHHFRQKKRIDEFLQQKDYS